MSDRSGPWQIVAKAVRSVLLGTGAGVLMVSAAILALEDRAASASVMAGLFLLSVVVLYLPQIEHFKGFGVEAKMRETLRQAEVTIEQLRRMALATTKQGYFVLASVGRMSEARITEKNELAKGLGILLDELEIHPAERRDAKLPYVQMIGVDLATTFNSCLHLLIRQKLAELSAEINATQPLAMGGDTASKIRIDELSQRCRALEISLSRGAYSFDSVETFRQHAGQPVFGLEFNAQDLDRLRRVRDHVIGLFRECEAAGFYTENAEAFVIEFGPYAKDGSGIKLMSSPLANQQL